LGQSGGASAASAFPAAPGLSTDAAPRPTGADAPKSTSQEELRGADREQEDGDAEEEQDNRDAGDTVEPTGEEDEEVAFRADCKLWKLVRETPTPAKAAAPSGSSPVAGDRSGEQDAAEGTATADGRDEKVAAAEEKGWRWQERGCGIVHINRHAKTGAGRLVMRMRGVLKLVLNTPVFPTAKYEKVGQKSVRFVGFDTDEQLLSKDGQTQAPLCAFRLNLQSNDQQGKFLSTLRDLLGVTATT